MCTIIGFNGKGRTILKNNFIIQDILNKILFVRGRDGVGIAIYGHTIKELRTWYIPRNIIREYKLNRIITAIGLRIFGMISHCNECIYSVLIHARAIPETENQKGLQPVRYKNIVLIHNGLIYNDKEILPAKYHGYIDSLALAYYLNSRKNITEQIFNEIRGSYSVLYIDMNDDSLNYITNYMPLYRYRINDNELSIYTNIEPKYVVDGTSKYSKHLYAEDIKPYSFGTITI
jgi:predicted glutamine amidotransferase